MRLRVWRVHDNFPTNIRNSKPLGFEVIHRQGDMPSSNNTVTVRHLLWGSHLLGKLFRYFPSSPRNHWFVRAWELAALKGRVLNGLDLLPSLLIYLKIVICCRQTWSDRSGGTRLSGLFLPLFDRLTFSSTLHLRPKVWGPIAPAEGIAGSVLYSRPWHQRLFTGLPLGPSRF